MRIEDLKIFVDVVRYHSMNIAAEMNYTTPQNLSKIIKRMEDELGVVLFNRSRKGSELTQQGEIFYLQVIDILMHYNNAILMLKNPKKHLNDEGLLQDKRLSVLVSIGAIRFAVLQAFEKTNLDSSISLVLNEISYANPSNVVEHLKINRYDVIACCVYQENVDSFIDMLNEYAVFRVFFDEQVLIVSKDNPLSTRNVVKRSELINQSLIQLKDFTFENSKFQIENLSSICINSPLTALELIAKSSSYCGLLLKKVSMVNSDMFSDRGDLKFVEIDEGDEEKFYAAYIIAVHRKKMHDRVILDFINYIDEVFMENNE